MLSNCDRVVFSKRNFTFCEYAWPQNFAYSQATVSCVGNADMQRSERQKLLYIAYRLAICLYFFCWLVYDGINDSIKKETQFFFIYLTVWSYVLLNLQMLFGFGIALWAYRNCYGSNNNSKPMNQWDYRLPIPFRVYWILTNITFDAALLVTLIYWTLLFDPRSPAARNPGNYQHHLAQSIYVIVELLLISAVPFRLAHFWTSIIYGIIYVIFTGIYYAAGGLNTHGKRYIYTVLNYQDHLTSSIVTVFLLLFIAVPIIHLLVTGIYWLKICIYSKFYHASCAVADDKLPNNQNLNKIVQESESCEQLYVITTI